MRHIKQYEEYTYKKSQLKVGDVVVCIKDANQSDLKLNHKYIITKIYNDDVSEFCNIKDIDTDIEYDFDFYTNRFMPELEYDIKRYNL